MLKFATAQIIAASLGDQQQRFTKAAHRATFDYTPREGYLYIRSRAISSRCNDNHDEFPADEIAGAYRTFVGKPVFVNHVNDNHRRARGVIIDAALHQDKNPDGTPDTWAEVLMEVDAVRFPKLAQAILAGKVDRTSMGCDVAYSICSACGNRATTPAEYCSHIPRLKGQRIFRRTASGQHIGELVREICHGLGFFENSLLVEPPADPTAHFLGVDASGLGKEAAMKHKAGANGDLPQGLRFAFHENYRGQGQHGIEATLHHPETDQPMRAGYMEWQPHDGMIGMIETHRDYRRRGIGDAMLARAHDVARTRNLTPPRRSDIVFPDGAAWNGHDRVDTSHDFSSNPTEIAAAPGPRHNDIREHLQKEHGMNTKGLDWPDETFHGTHEKWHEHSIGNGGDTYHVHGSRREAAIDPADYDTDDWDDDEEQHPEVLPKPAQRSEPDVSRHSGQPYRRQQQEADAAWSAASPHTTRPHHPGMQSLNSLQTDAAPRKKAPAKPKPAEPELDAYGTPKPKRGDRYENPGDHPWFKQIPMHHDNIVKHWEQATDEEKDSGMRWYHDAHHVAKSIAKLDPDITDDAEAAHKGAGVLSAYSPRTNWPQNLFNAAHSFLRKKAVRPLKEDPDKPDNVTTTGAYADKAQRVLDGEDHHLVNSAPKTHDFGHLIEHAGYEPQNEQEKASGASRKFSSKVVIDRHAMSVAAGRRITDVENDAHGKFPGAASGTHSRHYYEHPAGMFRTAAAVISDREGREIAPHQVQAVTWLVRQRLNKEEENAPGSTANKGRSKGRETSEKNMRENWKDLAGKHMPELKENSNSHVALLISPDLILADGTISAVAYGEVKAPQDVDTLREENCPVCGDSDTYDGEMCHICGFISPPDQFRDPDLNAAKNMDLRKQVVDPSMVDDNGDLQRVDGQGGPAGDPAMQGDQPQLGPDGQPLDPNDPAAQQSMDAAGPGATDRNGDGMIDPSEIDDDGNVNAQDLIEPEQGGQTAPRELPYWGQDHTGDFFTQGPDMPLRPQESEGPVGPEGLSDEDKRGMPIPGTPGDGVPDVFCPNCGFGADASPPKTQDLTDPQAAAQGLDGIVAGDVCPSCQRAQLLTPGEINSNYSKAPAVERPAWS